MTSSAGYVQPPRQGPLAWATEGQPHPAFPPYPPSCPGSPPEGERGPGKASRQHDCPAALRLGLRPGRGGPARGGVGETIGKVGKGERGGDEAGTRGGAY